MIAWRAWRAIALCVTLVACLFRYGICRWRRPSFSAQRAHWLQQSCRAVLRCMNIALCVDGSPPAEGIVVSNHLSYLDIAVLGAVLPVCFVSKAEVRRWPLLGVIARAGGTIFLHRSSLTSASATASQITERMNGGVPVLLFPEGTTSDGSLVMRFHSLLLESATRAGLPITATALRYDSGYGLDEREFCWFGEQHFLPHLWRILGTPSLTAQIRFGMPRVYSDRRTAAAQTHDEVAAMRTSRGKNSTSQ